MKEKRYKVKSDKIGDSDILVIDTKTDKRKFYAFTEFIKYQLMYNPETAQYPKYVNDRVWEIEERRNND